MLKYDRKSLLATGLAGLVFAAGSSAQGPVAPIQPGWLAKELRAAQANAKRAQDPPRVVARRSGGEALQLAAKSDVARRVDSPTGRYFVKLKQAPVVQYLAANRSAPNAPLNMRGSAATNYEAQVRQEQSRTLQAIGSALGRSVTPRVQLTHALNGFSIDASPAEAARLEQMPGVARVTPVLLHPLDTDVGPGLIGAPSIWDGSATGGTATLGEGITVGIIDSGINSNHPSFAATAGAYTHTNPLPGGTYLGHCATTPAFCNDKLIGAYDFVFDLVDGEPDVEENPSPEDNNSHGSHTASTVAGNPIQADFGGVTALAMSGVAPRANIIAYDVCYNEISTGRGLCPGDASAAAVEQAIEDGVVSVINFSIGGGDDPYNDLVSEAFLAATEAGIYIAASAGNDGPDAETVGHNEPWTSTTAATTHGRAFATRLSVTGPTQPPEFQGVDYLQGSGTLVTAPIAAEIESSAVVAPANVDGCLPFAPNAFQDAIALILRGNCDFVVKVRNAQAAGAVAVVMRNNQDTALIIQSGLDQPDVTIPSVMIPRTTGEALSTYIAANPTATLRIDPQLSVARTADVVADFSSRGPNSGIDILKPELAAPGVDILAAVADGFGDIVGTEVNLLSGTSMASPHNAGSAALLRALRPDWTPMQVKSALMLTARTAGLVKEDESTPADPLDIGNGRVQVAVAARAGLVMDESIADFENANPDNGGDVRQLNLASLYSSNCITTANCEFTRTFTNTTNGSVSWSVAIDPPADVDMSASPSNFTLSAGQSQVVVFSADATDRDPLDGFGFGTVTLSDDADVLEDLHLSVALQASAGIVPETVTIQTRRDAGSQGVEGLVLPPATDLTFDPSGLIRGTQVTAEVAEDSDNADVFDNVADGTHFTLIQPNTFGMRFVAEIIASESPDLDLYLGIDANNDGQPQANELIEFAATSSALERAEVRFLPPGFRYWILVQNWNGSANAPDAFTMSYAYVPYGDAGNLAVDAPSAPAAGQPFDITVFFDEPAMVQGERWYGAFDVLPDPGSSDILGTMGVDIVRQLDDVVKTANVANALPGTTVRYTLTVRSNVTPETLNYTIQDVVPANMQVVPASVQASAGTVQVNGQTIDWTVPMIVPFFDYLMSTSATDATCTMPLATADGVADRYLNLSALGVNPSAYPADGAYSFNVAGVNGGIPFYQPGKLGTLFFNDNGVFSFDNASIFSAPSMTGANVAIPNAGLPNSLLALLWRDMSFQGGGAGSGYTSINLTAGGAPVGRVIEFDNLTLAGNPADTIDAQIYLDSRVLANAPEVVFAYANPTGAFVGSTTGTIGVENLDGSRGQQLAHNTAAVARPSGSAVCFNLVQQGAAATLVFDAVVQAAAAGTSVVNSATHTVDNPGAEPAVASATVNVPQPADLAISKTDNQSSVLAGAPVTYTIVASNTSATTAASGTVSDTFAASLQTCTWTCLGSAGNTCGASGAGNIADPVTLAPGGSVTYTAACTVAPTATGTLTNTATVASVQDGNAANNSATDTTTIVPRIDVSISKTDDLAIVNAGSPVTYTLVARNLGTLPVNATVADTFPAPLAACTWTCSGPAGNTCTASGNGNIADGATLLAGGSVTYVATCQVPTTASGTISNTATIAVPNDPNLADNLATDTTVVRPQADLSITKTDNVQVVNALGTVTYQIVVSNLGTGDVVGATVTDNFPAPLQCEWTCSGANGGSCTASGTGSIADTIDLAAGASVSYTATCALNNFPGNSLVNTATVAYANDPVAANNTATDTNEVTPSPDLIFRSGFEN